MSLLDSASDGIGPFVDMYAKIYDIKTQRKVVDAQADATKRNAPVDYLPSQTSGKPAESDRVNVYGVEVNKTLAYIGGGLLVVALVAFAYKKIM